MQVPKINCKYRYFNTTMYFLEEITSIFNIKKVISIIIMHLHFYLPSGEWENQSDVQTILYNLVMEPNFIFYSAQSCPVL